MLNEQALGKTFTSALEIAEEVDDAFRELLAQPRSPEELAAGGIAVPEGARPKEADGQEGGEASGAETALVAPEQEEPEDTREDDLILLRGEQVRERPPQGPPAHPALALRVLSGALRRALLDGELGGDYYVSAPLEVELAFFFPIPTNKPIICAASCVEVEEHERHGDVLRMEISGRNPGSVNLFAGEILWRLGGREWKEKKREKRSLPHITRPGGQITELPHMEPWDRGKNETAAELFREDDPIFFSQRTAKMAGFATRVMPWTATVAMFVKVASHLFGGLHKLTGLRVEFLATPYCVPLIFDKPIAKDAAHQLEAFDSKKGRILARAYVDLGELEDLQQKFTELGARAFDDEAALEELVCYICDGYPEAVEAFRAWQQKVQDKIIATVEAGQARAEKLRAEAEELRRKYEAQVARWQEEHPGEIPPARPHIPPPQVPAPQVIPLPPDMARFLEGVPEIEAED